MKDSKSSNPSGKRAFTLESSTDFLFKAHIAQITKLIAQHKSAISYHKKRVPEALQKHDEIILTNKRRVKMYEQELKEWTLMRDEVIIKLKETE